MQTGAAPPHQFAFAGELYVSKNTMQNEIGCLKKRKEDEIWAFLRAVNVRKCD
jgi:uncharacterized protein YegP (UPF0339 family)